MHSVIQGCLSFPIVHHIRRTNLSMTISDEATNKASQGDDAKWHNRLGGLLSASGKYSAAIPHFVKALDILPSYSSAHFNLASALVFVHRGINNQEQSDRAIFHFQQAILYQPHFPEAHVNLAAQLYTLNQCELALSHALQAIEQDPDNNHGYYNLNTIYRALSQQDKAIELCWQRIEKNHLIQRPHISKPVARMSLSLSPLSVVCVKWGIKYDAAYVNKLYRGISRHVSLDFQFFCVTEDSRGLCPGKH
jgi:tetratricopeptide (TPR) repeat protein